MKEFDPRLKGSVFFAPDRDSGDLASTESQAKKPDIPTVLRNKRGKIVWKLPGNTLEQNEQIGIRNVQALFLEKFPEFDELFPRREYGLIDKEKREEAKKFILDNIGIKDKFIAITGSAPAHSNSTPYFNGSFLIAMQKSFQPWNIDFQFRIVDQETGRYVDKNGIVWLTFGLLHGQYGCDYRTLQKHLKSISQIQGFGRNGHDVTLYRESEASDELRGYVNLPKVNEQSGVYVDENGEKWLSLQYFYRTYQIARQTIQRRFNNMRSIKGRTGSGQENDLYNESDLKDKLKDFLSLPQVSIETNVYIDDQNESWAPITFLIAGLNVSLDIKPKLKNVRKIEGRTKRGRIATFYNVSEARKILGDFSSLPQVNGETARYVDSEGKSWITVSLIRERLIGQIKDLDLENINCIEGRSSNGVKTILYSELEVTEKFKDLLVLPQIDNTGIYIDIDGERWVPKHYFIAKMGIGGTTIDTYLEGVSRMTTRGIRLSKIVVYRESEVLKNLDVLLTLPKVDKKNGVYIDENGEHWVGAEFFRRNLGLDGKFILKRLKQVRAIKGRDKANRIAVLYNESEAREELKERIRKPRGYWTTEQIEEEAMMFYLEHGDLSTNLLEKFGRHDLIGGINKYQGGLRALKEKLAISFEEKNRKEPISPQEAKEEFDKFFENP